MTTASGTQALRRSSGVVRLIDGGWLRLASQRRARHVSTGTPPPRRSLQQLTVAGATLIVVVVHGVNLGGWPGFFDDEGTYFSQGWAVTHRAALAPYTYWYDHPPLGWIQLGVLSWPAAALTGGPSALLAGRIVMVAVTATSALLIYALGRRLGLGQVAALAAMLLWGTSPLVVFEGRQVFLDNLAVPWLLASFVLAVNRRRDLWQHLAAGACFGVAVLTKETVAVLLVAVGLALWQHSDWRTRLFSLVGFGSCLGAIIAMYPLFAVLRGEFLPGGEHVSLWQGIAFQFSRQGSGFLLRPGSGSWGLLGSWIHQDAVLILAGTAGGLAALAVGRLRCLGVATAVIVLLALRPGGYLPYMYVVVLLPFSTLGLAGTAEVLWRAARRSDRGLELVPGARARLRPPHSATAVLLAVALCGVAAWAPVWWDRTRVSWTDDANAAHESATRWITGNLPHNSVVVADNTFWVDLVNAGWSGDGFHGAVWFYKLDLDSAARHELPHGWRDVDYVIWSPTLAADPQALPRVHDVYRHSELVRSWHSWAGPIEVRRVVGR